MMFQCPLCGDILERDIKELKDGQPFFNKRERSFKSFCEKFNQSVTCRQYDKITS